MKYTVEVNEKSVVVTLDGYKGVAKCCEGDTFNLQTGIELALERAKVAKANANKSKPTVAEAIKVLEEYVGDHIAIVGRGVSLSENQKAELRAYADRLAPIDECEDEDEYEDYDEDDYEDDYEECEPNCGCHDNGGCECGKETLDTLAARMIARIREILAE
jgi:hypothetical protein